jgi:hypothetical protein
MTIPEWNLILNSVMTGLMIGGGLWLKYVVEQQLKSKDTTIEALKGVVQLKDAQISSLEGNTAPAIAQAYAAMKTHAEGMTVEQLRLSEEVNNLNTQLRTKELTAPVRTLIGESSGILIAERIVRNHIGAFLFPTPPKPPEPSIESMARIIESYMQASEELIDEAKKRHTQIDAMLCSAENEPKQLKQ